MSGLVLERKRENKSEFAIFSLVVFGISLALFLIAIALHCFAGLTDKGRIVIRPVGHFTVITAFGWFCSIIGGTASAILCKARMRLFAGLLVCVSVLGLTLLFSV